MTAYVSPLTAVGDAVYGTLLADSTLAGLLPGGVQTDVPENPTYPFLWIELLEDTQFGGFGPWPGTAGTMPGLELRLHVYQSQYGTSRDAQIALARAIEVIAAVDGSGVPTLTVSGYSVWLVAYEQAVPLPDQELNGVKVQELVGRFRLIVEES